MLRVYYAKRNIAMALHWRCTVGNFEVCTTRTRGAPLRLGRRHIASMSLRPIMRLQWTADPTRFT